MGNNHEHTVAWRHAHPDMARRSGEVIRTLLRHGHEAYWVGGCVRDEYMGRPVHDMDIATSARPEITAALFPKVIPTGMQHGTVTVMHEGEAFEVTTYRTETGYDDHRRPSEVTFVTDIEEDLQRRDFTMNAMARGLDGAWVDPYGGRRDIEARRIRCVGDPRLRFQEDGLRMVRCIRFASVLGFAIAPGTWRAIKSEQKTLRWIAMERIRIEMDKVMAGPHPRRGLALFVRSGLYDHMKVPFPYTGHEEAWMRAIDHVDPLRLEVRWALLLLGCGLASEAADPLLRAWTFSNKDREAISAILRFQESWVRLRDEGRSQDHLAWIRLVLDYGSGVTASWLAMQHALTAAGAEETADTAKLDDWLQQMVVYSLKELNVTGNELLSALEKRGGPWLGELLNQLLVQVAAGRVPNEKSALIEDARRVVIHEEG